MTPAIVRDHLRDLLARLRHILGLPVTFDYRVAQPRRWARLAQDRSGQIHIEGQGPYLVRGDVVQLVEGRYRVTQCWYHEEPSGLWAAWVEPLRVDREVPE